MSLPASLQFEFTDTETPAAKCEDPLKSILTPGAPRPPGGCQATQSVRRSLLRTDPRLSCDRARRELGRPDVPQVHAGRCPVRGGASALPVPRPARAVSDQARGALHWARAPGAAGQAPNGERLLLLRRYLRP